MSVPPDPARALEAARNNAVQHLSRRLATDYPTTYKAIAALAAASADLLDALAAAPPSPPEEWGTTFQWLIERGQPEGETWPVWLEHSASHPARDKHWTRNAHDAAMFPDRQTAETWIADNDLAARAVEHGFMARSEAPPSPPLIEAEEEQ